jgi:hypothetical protein
MEAIHSGCHLSEAEVVFSNVQGSRQTTNQYPLLPPSQRRVPTSCPEHMELCSLSTPSPLARHSNKMTVTISGRPPSN